MAEFYLVGAADFLYSIGTLLALEQQGPPVDIARRPRSNYVANPVGLNLFRGAASGTTGDIDIDGQLTIIDRTTGRHSWPSRPPL
ncbi:hypothetical protein OG563_38440 [Nocardia vinacea]|uniref:Uncharacterized protein n=1 Tax=Nocardia vinacea TaxID=96468 RepID=A0ABZ1YNZ5_9NOCA|nr:hypothetical protein [Nocardia vinacea]